MFLFLSWSGTRSRKAAEAFHTWLPDILQSVTTWMSSEDICSGAGWNQEIRAALQRSNFGIIFVTRDNLSSNWLLFEAGAIAKHVDEARVVPLLVDEELKPAMLTGPLAQLHAREATEEQIGKLVRDINFCLDRPLSLDRVNRLFKHSWNLLETEFTSLPEPEGPPPEIDTNAMVSEILRILRSGRSSAIKADGIRILPPGLSNPVLSQESRTTYDEMRFRRLRLRIEDMGIGPNDAEKIQEFWRTIQEDEQFVSVRGEGCTYTVYANGEISCSDDVPF